MTINIDIGASGSNNNIEDNTVRANYNTDESNRLNEADKANSNIDTICYF